MKVKSKTKSTKPRKPKKVYPSEEWIQTTIIAYWRAFGTRGSLLAHIPNGMKRNIRTAVRLKAMGVLPGMPDLICGSKKYGLFFLELKRHGGKPTEDQTAVHALLVSLGYEVYIRDGLDEALELLRGKGVIR